MAQLTSEQRSELKALLSEERRELAKHLEGTNKPSDDQDYSLKGDVGELSSVDNHPADLGTEVFERGRDAAVDESLSEQLAAVDQALDRLAGKEYGQCEVCGEDIPFERLQALPSATRCIEHAAEDATSSDYRPIEEEVLMESSDGIEARDREEDGDEFDDADAWHSVEQYGNASDTIKPDAK